MVIFIPAKLGFLGVVVIFSPCLFFDVFLNAPKKKRLLDEYAESGIDVQGFVARQKIETSLTDEKVEIQYAYRAPNSNELVLKGFVRFPSRATRTIRVKVLPGHPESGYPNVLIARRGETYGEGRVTCQTIFLAACVVLGAFVIGFGAQCLAESVLSGDASAAKEPHFCSYHPLLVYPVALVLFTALGYPSTEWSYRRWERDMLEGTKRSFLTRTRGGGLALAASTDCILPLELFAAADDNCNASEQLNEKLLKEEHHNEVSKGLCDQMAVELV